MSMLSGCALLLVVFVRTVSSVVNGSPLASVDNLGIWDVEAYFFFGDAEGFPTTLLIVILDSVQEAVGEIKLNSDIRAFVVCKVPLFFGRIYSRLKVPFGNVLFSSSVYWYPFFEDLFCY